MAGWGAPYKYHEIKNGGPIQTCPGAIDRTFKEHSGHSTKTTSFNPGQAQLVWGTPLLGNGNDCGCGLYGPPADPAMELGFPFSTQRCNMRLPRPPFCQVLAAA
jgi:hypothetical protein